MKITTANWIFLDTETTGLKPKDGDRIIELGWVTVRNMKIVANEDHLINPEMPIPPKVQQITHITDQMVAGKPTFAEIITEFQTQFQAADFIAAYNKDFDREMLETEFRRAGATLPEKEWLDPLTWARGFLTSKDAFGQPGDVENHKLTSIAKQFKVSLENAHRADADAAASTEILIKFFEWGVDEANFPDDVDAIKDMEHGIFRNVRAKGRMLDPLKKKDPETGWKKVQLTGEPGKHAQDIYDNYNRERLLKLAARGRWGK